MLQSRCVLCLLSPWLIYMAFCSALPSPLVVSAFRNATTAVLSVGTGNGSVESLGVVYPTCGSNITAVQLNYHDTTYALPFGGLVNNRLSCFGLELGYSAQCDPNVSSAANVTVLLAFAHPTDPLAYSFVVEVKDLFRGSVREAMLGSLLAQNLPAQVQLTWLFDVRAPSRSLSNCTVSVGVSYSSVQAGNLSTFVPLLVGTSPVLLVAGSPFPSTLLFRTTSISSAGLVNAFRVALVNKASGTMCNISTIWSLGAVTGGLLLYDAPSTPSSYLYPTSSSLNATLNMSTLAVGLYTVCVGSTTDNTSGIDVGVVELFGASPSFVRATSPLLTYAVVSESAGGGLVVAASPQSSVLFSFAGQGLQPSSDSAFMTTNRSGTCEEMRSSQGIMSGLNALSLTAQATNSSSSIVEWNVTFGNSTLVERNLFQYRFCYNRALHPSVEVPLFDVLTATAHETLGADGSNTDLYTTTTTTTTTTAVPTTTLSPIVMTTATSTRAPTTTRVPTTTAYPSPSIPGGCPLSSAAVLQSMGANNGIALYLTRSFRGVEAADFLSTMSATLCVALTDIVYDYLAVSQVDNVDSRILAILILSTPLYNGTERAAYFLNDTRSPLQDAAFRTKYHIAQWEADRFSLVDFSQRADSGGVVGQVVVGVAVAGVICFAICLCGLGCLCCRRLRQQADMATRIDPIRIENGVTVVTRAQLRQRHGPGGIVVGVVGDGDDSDAEEATVNQAVTGVIIREASPGRADTPPPDETAKAFPFFRNVSEGAGYLQRNGDGVEMVDIAPAEEAASSSRGAAAAGDETPRSLQNASIHFRRSASLEKEDAIAKGHSEEDGVVYSDTE